MTSLLLTFKTGHVQQLDGETFIQRDEYLVLDNILIPKAFLDAGQIKG